MVKMRFLFLFVLVFASIFSFAQKTSKYDPHEAFAPQFYPENGNNVRTADGRPGPTYWQNKADYKINVTLDDVENTIAGNVTITYTNNSPYKLPFVWLQLDQNLYAQSSKGMAATTIEGGRWSTRNDFNGGYKIKSAKVIQDGKGSFRINNNLLNF